MKAMRSCPCRSEVVWKDDLSGTAETPGGEVIEIGEGSEWTPERMASTAAQASLMIEFLRLAGEAGIDVMGYLSNAASTIVPAGGLPARMVISPCVVVASEADATAAESLLRRAVRQSAVCGLFGDSLEIVPDFIVPASAPE